MYINKRDTEGALIPSDRVAIVSRDMSARHSSIHPTAPRLHRALRTSAKKINFQGFILTLLLCVSTMHALVPERVIIASDLNRNYIEFWPAVAHWWQDIVGIKKVTFAVVGGVPPQCDVSDENIEVIYVEPIKGVSTALHAQTIRMLLPILYPNEVCILGDIDMIPLSSDFFVKYGAQVPDDHLLIYHEYPESLGSEYYYRYPFCYTAARGSTYGEIFGISDVAQIPVLIKQWSELGWGFPTDERVLYAAVQKWRAKTNRVSFLDIPDFYDHRLSKKQALNFDAVKLAAGHYFDGHCPRPYSQYKLLIDAIVQAAPHVS
ncbi:MAG: hypothetical protein WCE21_03040 [Candidatus Babeliales bacterium]